MKSWAAAASAIAMTAFFALVIWSSYQVFALDRDDLYAENGLIENIQAVLLIFACLAFLGPVLFEKRSDKIILLFCALLCYAFVLRELDVEDMDIPDAIKFLGYGRGRNTSIALGLVLLLSFALLDFPDFKNNARGFLKSISGVLLMMGAPLLFAGAFFEKSTFIPHHVYFEEISELFGYVLILMSAFFASSFLSKTMMFSGDRQLPDGSHDS